MVSPVECEPGCKSSIKSKARFESESKMKPPEPATNLPKKMYVYRQDIVWYNKYEDMLGLVVEVAGDSDSDSDSEGSITDENDNEVDEECNEHSDDDADDDDDDGDSGESSDNDVSLSDGQVRIMWTDGSETTNNLGDITVVDREFLHGDIVASVSDPTGQLGRVVDVNILVDLRAPSGETLKNISSRNLKRVRDFIIGDYVVYGPWVGRVEEVSDNVTVLFDDGSACKVIKADPSRLKPVLKNMTSDADFPYYPGQRVRAVSSSVFKTSRWLSGLWKASRVEGTVTRVQAASVFVHWIASAIRGMGNSSATVPSEEQNPKSLIVLSYFAHANWQLSDWCLLPSPQGQALPSSSADTSKDVEGSIIGCKPNLKNSTEHANDDKYIYMKNSLGRSKPDFNILNGDHTNQQCPSQQYSDEASQDEGSEPHKLASIDFPNHLVSRNLEGGCSANSIVTDNLNENFLSGESECLICSYSSTRVAGASNAVVESSSLNDSSAATAKEHPQSSWPAYRKKLHKVLFKRERKAHKREEPFERAFFVACTMTKVDVAWQDGTREFGVDSKSLIPVQSPGDHDFFPEQYVVEKASNDSDDPSELKHVGVVRSANAKERTVCVRWLRLVSWPEDPREFDNEEVVSAYELAEHPDYDYCYGDLVIRLPPFSASVDAPVSEDPPEQEDYYDLPQENDEMTQINSGYKVTKTVKDESDMNFSSLSWVGHITGLQDGDVEVTWADGMVSMVGPQAIYVVERDDDEESFDGGSKISDDGASWETVEENGMGNLAAADGGVDLQLPTDSVEKENCITVSSEDENCITVSSEDNNPVRNGPLSFSIAALGFVSRLATGLFSLGRKEMDSLSTYENDKNKTESLKSQESSARDTIADTLSLQESNILDDHGVSTARKTAEIDSTAPVEAETEVEVDNLGTRTSQKMDVDNNFQRSCERDGSCSFKHFDIAKDALDHYFLGGNGQNTGGSKWIKKVQKEWSILEKNLPDAIFVRAFEDRMDLLRAVIVGACGTPYQDGLFFFDFHLPPEYPQVPPSTYYHSGGLRVNPNLYEEGKVCLSLLNTWTGKGNEVWDPNSSSILQVLVSVQGLVLNSKPYFNEAGYDKQVGMAEGEKNSVSYNENAYVLNLRSMLYLLRRPPMHFEDFVKDHFRRRGHYILKACDAYMKGCIVGALTKDACVTNSISGCSSVGFKLMLAKITPKLLMALSEVGADCQPFRHLQTPQH